MIGSSAVVTLRPKECSCKGLNEYCFKCDGRGFVGEGTPELTEPPIVPRPEFACSMCPLRFEDLASLKTHTDVAHGMFQRLPPPESASLTGRDAKVSCLKCKGIQWALQLDRHIEFEHLLTVDQRAKGFVFCPICRTLVKAQNKRRHMLNVHPQSRRTRITECSSSPDL